LAEIYLNSQKMIPYSGRRGLNLAIIDQNSGQLLDIAQFDTYESTTEADSMARYIQKLPTGRLVLAAIRDDGSAKMTEQAYLAFESLGSKYIRQVNFRDSWALIGQKGVTSSDFYQEAHQAAGSGAVTLVDTLILAGNGQEFYLTFNDSSSASKRYVIAAQSAMKQPFSAKRDTCANLKAITNGADLIIISHKNFWNSAQRLAQFHASSNNLRVSIADIEQIYDEFNNGIIDPKAVKDFLRYTYLNWQAPAPTYVALFGDASWDFKKNFSDSSKTNFVPSYGNPVSDNWFVCLDGDRDFLPEMFIGRIPVETREQAEFVTDKIIAYQNTPTAEWKKDILFITGGYNSGEQTTFMSQSKAIVSRYVTPPPASCHPLQINKTTEGYIEGEKRDEILTAMNHGLVWMNFLGHAGSGTWDLMFNHPDIEELSNFNKYPFITSMTCHTGRFANPDITSFAEHFLVTKDKGAIAFWGTTGWGFVFQDDILIKNLFQSVLVDTVHNLSKATTISKIRLWENLGENIYNTSTIQQYTLIGDPLTDLTLPKQPDLEIGSQDVEFDPPNPAEADSVLKIKIKVHNWGLATRDSVRISIQDSQNSSTVIASVMRPAFGLLDSFSINWNLRDQSGQHQISVTLDPDNVIDEVTKANNTYQFPVYVYSSKYSISKPIEYQVLSLNYPLVLQVNNPNRYNINYSFQFEIDTTQNFNSPALISSPLTSPGKIITRWNAPHLSRPGIYFWRCRTVEQS
jgi:hypothetical protein